MKWCAAETVLHAEFVTIPNLRCIAIARPKTRVNALMALHRVREKSVRNSEWLPHSSFTTSYSFLAFCDDKCRPIELKRAF